jgi:hypothetical protein
MAQEPIIQIWPGSGSFCPGMTPFGYFDSDPHFIMDSEKVALWCARRLGYPITDIELTEENFYSAFEEAILEYNSLVNSFSARDNLLTLSGQPTASLQLESQYIQPTLNGIFKLAKQYGTEVGAGGTQIWYTGSINLVAEKQTYDLTEPGVVNLEEGNFSTDQFTIRRIFHEDTSPLARYLDPIGYSGIANQEFLNQFGWGNMGVQYTLMPLQYDLMRLQGVEMHNQIRRSGHSFQLTANRLRVFPIPREESKLFFHYSLDTDVIDGDVSGNLNRGVISDFSNIPYGIKKYKFINEIGKNWIRRYTLALSKEMLGYVRGKYSSIPMTLDNEVTLNGADLIGAAQTEKDALVAELNEMLDSMSRQSQLERKQAESTALASQLVGVPLKIYVR